MATPKVLVPEQLSDEGLALLRKTLVVDQRNKLSAAEILIIIPEYDALVVRSETQVTEELLRAGTKLKVVARAGVGVDNINVAAATKEGIIVVNSPSGNIGAAAEHTVTLLLASARNVAEASSSLKAGKWERSRFVGVEVKGKTLGIIGLGKVGVTVARCAIGLGMRVEALDPYASPALAESVGVTMKSTLPDLLASADWITIHTPLMASTRDLIAVKEIQLMKRGSRLLNVARGGVINEAALLEALESGHIAGAGIDVWTSEPPTEGSVTAKLAAHPRVVSTPHLGASTVEAQENVSIDVCEQCVEVLGGGLPRSAVNAPLILPSEYQTLQPFVRLLEKIGSLYTQYYSASDGRYHPHSAVGYAFDLIYEGELAKISNSKPLYAAFLKGLIGSVSSTNVTLVNAELVAKERGVIINEQYSRSPADPTYSSLITLRARPATPSRSASPFDAKAGSQTRKAAQQPDRLIAGYVSASQVFISRLDRFATSFVPDGQLLICRNYGKSATLLHSWMIMLIQARLDSPGMVGKVGSLLGQERVNIRAMTVAPLSLTNEVNGETPAEPTQSNEALMILSVDREVDRKMVERLGTEHGIMDVIAVGL